MDENFKLIFNNQHNRFLYQHLICSIPFKHTLFLKKLKNMNNFEPLIIYDIGANLLQWTKEAKKIWPNSKIILFEAIDELKFLYENFDYSMGVLTNEDHKLISFYQNLDYTAGSSYYKEIGMGETSKILFNEESKINKIGMTLDTIVELYNYPLPNLIKIDSQGSELDILMGAKKTLKQCKYLIVELQLMEYNQGAKLSEEAITIIENMGFTLMEKFCTNNNIYDADFCFVNNSL